MKNIVVDTNVFISALLKSRDCSEVLEALKRGRFNLVISEKLREEILEVASNPKFGFSEFDKSELRELLAEKSAPPLAPEEKISVCRDAKDDMLLECAVTGRADFIVTGDKDLLSLKTFRKTLIVTPRKFLQSLGK
ncbi:MAG: putative toxin-antitoxin system toxin component, PIN family [Endomicrobiia bacterium]|nr:putative toxin-antitoxin system toxin component, PIN family [Endomicrobiia bacterium]